MAGRTHLQLEDRKKIEEMMSCNYSIQEIAKALQRSTKTIERELERDNKESYSAERADEIARNNRKIHNKKLSQSARRSYSCKVKETVEKCKKLNPNISARDISDLTGISESNIVTVMRELNRKEKKNAKSKSHERQTV